MAIYILDSNYNRTALLDQYRSFIWTERFSEWGDFVIETADTYDLRMLLRTGVVLSHSESRRLMTIMKVSNEENSDGEKTLKVEGRSYEYILDTRAVTKELGKAFIAWKGSGTAGQVVTNLVYRMCVTGIGMTSKDIIPGLSVHNESRTSAIMKVALEPQSLYKAVQDICKSSGIGFKIEHDRGTQNLKFIVYKGIDRLDVLFGTSIDNMMNETYVESSLDHKNIAYVWAKDGARWLEVAAPGTSTSVTGLDRRVVNVMAEDIDFSDPESSNATRYEEMRQRGLEELSKHRRTTMMDGRLSPGNNYTYRVDYDLGDTVSIVDQFSTVRKVVITEYIWAHDAEGERSYPTFEYID